MNRKETLIVNLVGGPCSGKSTVAAQLFAELKKRNIVCELVPEYIKEEIYKENQTIPNNQLPLFGAEVYSLDNKIGKVDVIIHDGSLLNNIVYNQEKDQKLEDFIEYWFGKYNNLSFFIDRGDLKFEEYGRIHTQEQSLELDEIVRSVHDYAGEPLITVDTKTAVEQIIPIILERLTKLNEDMPEQKYTLVIPFGQAHQYCSWYLDYKFVTSNHSPDCYILTQKELEHIRKIKMLKTFEFYKIPVKYQTYEDIADAWQNGELDYVELEKYKFEDE